MPRLIREGMKLAVTAAILTQPLTVSAQEGVPTKPVAPPAVAPTESPTPIVIPAPATAPPTATSAPPAAPATTSAPAPPPGLGPMPVTAGTAPAPAAIVVPPPHPVLFRYYDKDGDGTLSQAEAAKLPPAIREWLVKEKIATEPGLAREAFEAKLPALTEYLRKRTAATIYPPVPLPMPGATPPNNSRAVGSSDFRALDLDQDGQVSFREWRALKRLANDFGPRDANGDGMITSGEFEQTKSAVATTTPSPPGSPPPGPGSPPASPATPSTPPRPVGPPMPASTASTLGTTASRQTFDSLDRNKDGMVNPDEWQNSRRIGPAFKEKGIDLTQPMSQAVFHETYAKVFPPRS